MPALPQLKYTWDSPAPGVRRVTLVGDLVNVNADQVLDEICDVLTAQPGLSELRVDCADVDVCDSRGLSVLLMLRRRTAALGISLNVTNRGKALQYLLERTGTEEYLTGEDHTNALSGEETSG